MVRIVALIYYYNMPSLIQLKKKEKREPQNVVVTKTTRHTHNSKERFSSEMRRKKKFLQKWQTHRECVSMETFKSQFGNRLPNLPN